jgi:hypothetical protein
LIVLASNRVSSVWWEWEWTGLDLCGVRINGRLVEHRRCGGDRILEPTTLFVAAAEKGLMKRRRCDVAVL